MKKQIIEEITKIHCDSTHELHFIWWLLEAKKYNLIHDFSRVNEPIEIIQSFKINIGKKSQTILRNLSYTPDFKVEVNYNTFQCNIVSNFSDRFNSSALFFIDLSSHSPLLLDVKNPFNSYNKRTIFSIMQKVLYNNKKLFVNEVEVQKLFYKTFTPKRYFKKDDGKGVRSITYDITTIEQFMKRHGIT